MEVEDLSEKYNDPRWQKKRLKVFERDGFRCQACGTTTETLHAHHKRYSGELWDSIDDDIQTLCEVCHKSLGHHRCGGIWYYFAQRLKTLLLFCEHCPACKYLSFIDNGHEVKCLDCHATLPADAGDIVFCESANVIKGVNRLKGIHIAAVYAAGKVSSSWRNSLVYSYSCDNHSSFWDKANNAITDAEGFADEVGPWPVVHDAVQISNFDSLSYTGPFWNPEEGCGHGNVNSMYRHGAFTEGFFESDSYSVHEDLKTQNLIAKRCVTAMSKTDLFFAWIDSLDCLGTLVEIGYFSAANPDRITITVIAFSNKLDAESIADLWFCRSPSFADVVLFADRPEDAWQQLWSGKYRCKLIP